jgi:excisionase family DNA binding protein
MSHDHWHGGPRPWHELVLPLDATWSQFRNGAQNDYGALTDVPEPAEPGGIPFAQRLACTIDEACEATGLGRTKLYELIGDGRVSTTTVGRRRLVLVQSLLSLVG